MWWGFGPVEHDGTVSQLVGPAVGAVADADSAPEREAVGVVVAVCDQSVLAVSRDHEPMSGLSDQPAWQPPA